MKDLWERLNDDIPIYFKDIAEIYNMKFIKISRISTALVTDKFALLITLDRFSASIDYIMRDKNGALINYSFGNFFAERLDSLDRQNLISEHSAKEIIINNFIVISNGLKNKWNNLFNGDTEWIEDFEKSIWYSIRKMNDRELEALEDLIK